MSLQEWHIKIDTSGDASTIYTDAIDLSEIGRLDITRASNVEWSNELQCWLVDILPHQRFLSRREAIHAEIYTLQQRLIGALCR